MKVNFKRKVLDGFFLALGILTLLGIYSYRNSDDSMATSQLGSNTNKVFYHIEKLHSTNLKMGAELTQFSINVVTGVIIIVLFLTVNAALQLVCWQ